jgi:hypothetical protein
VKEGSKITLESLGLRGNKEKLEAIFEYIVFIGSLQFPCICVSAILVQRCIAPPYTDTRHNQKKEYLAAWDS